jgi:hypothetical protein
MESVEGAVADYVQCTQVAHAYTIEGAVVDTCLAT